MNIIPLKDNPTMEYILQYSEKIPAFGKLNAIIQAELAKGNSITDIGDASFHPSETYVIIRFSAPAKNDYPEMTIHGLTNGNIYKAFNVSDNKGSVFTCPGVVV